MASAFVLYELVRKPRVPDDPTQQPYEYAMFCVWGSVEVNIAIVSGKLTDLRILVKKSVTNWATAACFPLLRPIAIKLVPKGILSSYGQKTSYGISGQGYHLSGNSYPQSQQRSRVGKVSTLVRSRAVKDDDTSSTYQLADINQGESFESVNGVKNAEGVHTIISGPASSVRSEADHGSGILVHNETAVEIEYDSRKDMDRTGV
jgi:hypothetical protein